MKNIKSVAVVIQNYIQYESFYFAINLMIKKGIDVDIFVPEEKNDVGFKNMYDKTYNYLKKLNNYNIKRKYKENDFYDALFMVAPVYQFLDLKRKYTIKYMYGFVTKPNYSCSLEVNNIFDIILTYGKSDAFLNNYAITYPIGNVKYVDFEKDKSRKNNKKNLLYLPTYGGDTNIADITKELIKLKKSYNLLIKAHHGTNYLNNVEEEKRRKLIEQNFDKIYSTEYSLGKLLKKADIVISDNSGAIWDAICTEVPVLISTENMQVLKYGNYIPQHYRAIENKDILEFNKTNDLASKIEETLNIKQIEKQIRLKNKIFCCENKDSIKLFEKFLEELDNGLVSEDYYKIHQNYKKEVEELLKNRFLLRNELLKNERFKKENLLLENQIKQCYNSTSWKITKPMRAIKTLIRKEIKR